MCYNRLYYGFPEHDAGDLDEDALIEEVEEVEEPFVFGQGLEVVGMVQNNQSNRDGNNNDENNHNFNLNDHHYESDDGLEEGNRRVVQGAPAEFLNPAIRSQGLGVSDFLEEDLIVHWLLDKWVVEIFPINM